MNTTTSDRGLAGNSWRSVDIASPRHLYGAPTYAMVVKCDGRDEAIVRNVTIAKALVIALELGKDMARNTAPPCSTATEATCANTLSVGGDWKEAPSSRCCLAWFGDPPALRRITFMRSNSSRTSWSTTRASSSTGVSFGSAP